MTTILVDRRPERDAGSPPTRGPAIRRVIAVALVPLALMVLNGCGLKGDLYLPDDQTPATPPAVLEDEPGREEDDAG